MRMLWVIRSTLALNAVLAMTLHFPQSGICVLLLYLTGDPLLLEVLFFRVGAVLASIAAAFTEVRRSDWSGMGLAFCFAFTLYTDAIVPFMVLEVEPPDLVQTLYRGFMVVWVASFGLLLWSFGRFPDHEVEVSEGQW